MAKTRNKKDTAKLAYEGIRQMLFNNEIMPGQKISYPFVAERLCMSLTPIIQALNRLEYQGIVHRKPNRGYFTEPMRLQEIEEIYELREAIELPLLTAVVKNLDDPGIQRLEGILSRPIDSQVEISLNERLMKDRDFHLAMVSLSNKKTQMQMLNHLYDLLYLKYRGSLLFVAQEEVVGSQHRIIFDAILSRDVKQARKAVRDHYKHIKSKALAALSRMIRERKVLHV